MVDHGTIWGRSCANSGRCKPLCACVDRPKFAAPASVASPNFFYSTLGPRSSPLGAIGRAVMVAVSCRDRCARASVGSSSRSELSAWRVSAIRAYLRHNARSLTGQLNRGIGGVLEIVRVTGRWLVSIAEPHAIIARAHLAQGEAKMSRDRFGFLERRGPPLRRQNYPAGGALMLLLRLALASYRSSS
jgi:hypothetical protein